MSSPKTMHIAVPIDWSPQQAKAVVDILEELGGIIWELYEDEITEHTEREQAKFIRAIRDEEA